MSRLPFIYSEANGLYRADYLPGEGGPVHREWRGLYDDDLWSAAEITPWQAFAVNNNNQEEVAVYLGLVWHLTAGCERLVIPTAYSVEAEAQLGRRGDTVQWEYAVETEHPGGAIEERGFVRSRSVIPINPPPNEWQRYMRDKAQVFTVSDFSDLVTLQRVTQSDAATELNLFAVHPERRAVVLAALASEERPVLQSLLEGDELFVDLCLGVDLGYNDALLVRSRRPLANRLQPLLERFEQAILTYEAEVDSLSDMPAALSAMSALAHPGMSSRQRSN